MQRLLPCILFCSCLLAVTTAVMAQQQPPAGTSVDNQALGYHILQNGRDSVFVKSNTVHAVIQANRTIAIVPNHRLNLRKGQRFSVTHRLSNTGNVPVTIIITAANTKDDDFDLQQITLSNGQKQAPRQAKAPSAPANNSAVLTATLQPGKVFTFTVSAVIPNSATAGDVGDIKVKAQTKKGQVIVNNTDELKVLAGPVIGVHKVAVEKNIKQGDALTYVITGNNSGDQNARAFNISIDGAKQQKVILRDKIPVNTTFLKSEKTTGGKALYHTAGSSKNDYSSTPPADLSLVDAFAIAFDSLAPDHPFKARFAVRVNQNAAAFITNIAQFDYRDPVDNAQRTSTAKTNMVKKTLPQFDATLDYYISDQYSTVSRATELGDDLRLQANAAACNLHVSRRDTTTIRLKSKKTGDVETVTAIETGPNTGIFRVAPDVPTVNASKVPVAKNDGSLQTLANDVIIATLPHCNQNKQPPMAQIVVSPRGIIFNSKNGKPVAGATITLLKVTAGVKASDTEGAPANVFGANGKTRVDNPQTTGPDGQFNFPFVKPGAYRIKVSPPAGFRFASAVGIANLPPNRSVDKNGSFGKDFTIKDTPGPVAFDVPVDPAAEGTLFIKKSASVASAQIGDFISYELTVVNNAGGPAINVHVEDTLPFGFRYQKGSTQIDGKAAADPDGGKGPSLRFNINKIAANRSVQITYRVLLGAGVRNGDATNTAIAKSNGAIDISSNTAENTIEVRGGVFSDKGYIVGKVFSDCNGNDVQDPGERGVPGVRLYLENGNYVITDSEGKYTFYGIRPTTHILKLDNYSLPPGSKLSVLDNRNALDPSSKFVDLKKGELHRADFAICNCDSTVQRQIRARRKAYHSPNGQEVSSSLQRNFSAQQSRSQQVKRAQASGLLNGNATASVDSKTPDSKTTRIDSSVTEVSKPDAAGDSAEPAGKIKAGPSIRSSTLEEVMVHEKAKLGFINLHDNDTLHTAQTRVRVKSKMGVSLSLNVNGKKIGDDKIGKRSTLAATHLQAYEYIGIVLKPGKNTLTLTQTDHFGNPRGGKNITVYAPGKVSQLKVTVPKNDVSADGSSAAVVRVQLQDKRGVPVKERLPVTLDVSIGTWLTKDLNPSKPGLQTFIETGSRTFRLQSPIKPQDARVRASIGTLQQETAVRFLPDLRPLIAAGIIQGTIRLNDGAGIVPARSADQFDKELKSLSYSAGNATADGRAAFFLKGKIKGNLLLTAGFNSEKDNDRLFRDIQPDKFYPVYGESSVKGYDAQSSSRLYVRVDHKRTYALYGDFITQDRNPAKSLGEYNRTQTGIKLHYEKKWGRANVFGSQTSSLQRIQIIRGRGISGPYKLKSDHILVNSEKIQIITRDRNQPSIIIKEKDLQRFRDYVIEPFTGNLIFKEAVRSLDKNLNPVFIRATYEVQDGGDNYLVGGADGALKLTNFLEVGGSIVDDRNPENKYHLKSLNSTVKVGTNTTVIGEVARTNTDFKGAGKAGRVELQHRGDRLQGRLYAGKTNKDFVNRSSQLRSGTTQAGARGIFDLASATKLKGEFIYARNDTLGSNTTGGKLDLQQRLGSNVKADVGFRYSKQNNTSVGGGSDNDIVNKNARGKLTLGIPKVEGASVYGEYEQNVDKLDRRLIAAGGSYKVNGIGRIYVRHEFISSAVGAYRFNSNTRRQNTVAGIDANFLGNGKVYSEYRVDDALDGANAQAAIGVKNRFEIYEGFGVNADVERVFSLNGNPSNEGTSVATSVKYTANPLWKGTARAEARFSNHSNSYLNTLGYGRKISANWTFLGKNIFSLQTSSGNTTDRIQQRARVGFAYRETRKNRWDALGRYELRFEQNGQLSSDYHRLIHIFSSNINFHPHANWTHSLRVAAKKVGESSAQFDSHSFTTLLSERSIYDITRKLDGGVNLSLMSDGNFGGKDYGAGFELGYLVHRNLRLAVGFNVFGFRDRDLAASKYTQKGAFLGFSYKFDERLFRGLIPKGDRHKELYKSCKKCKKHHGAALQQSRAALSKPGPVLPLTGPNATCDDCKNPDSEVQMFQPAQTATLKRLPEPKLIFKGLQVAVIKAPDFNYTSRKSLVKLPEDIHFATDKYKISNNAKQMLNLVAHFLKDQKLFYLSVYGYTDSRATYGYNLKLSKRRAYEVWKYLASQGVSPDLISFIGLGKRAPVVINEKDAIDRALNRRAELGLNISTNFVRQINDLQIKKKIKKGIPEWDYVFNTELNAVPGCIHLKSDSSKLNAVNKYMLNRIILALHYYPGENVIFKINNLQQIRIITSFMQQAGVDMKRLNFNFAARTPRYAKPITLLLDERLRTPPDKHEGDGKIAIVYGKNTKLKSVPQQDDVTLAGILAIKPMLVKMIDLLKLYHKQRLTATKK